MAQTTKSSSQTLSEPLETRHVKPALSTTLTPKGIEG